NQNPSYFYNGAQFRASDELTSYLVLKEIFDLLPPGNPLGSTMNGQFTALKDSLRTISLLKQSGLSPDELLSILDHNANFISFATPKMQTVFKDKLSPKTLPLLHQEFLELAKFKDEPLPIIGYQPLSTIFLHSLERALELSDDSDKPTKPIRAWRETW